MVCPVIFSPGFRAISADESIGGMTADVDGHSLGDAETVFPIDISVIPDCKSWCNALTS